MRRFLYALAMFMFTAWSRTWKKVFRSRRSFFITAGVVGLIAMVWIGVRLGGASPSSTETDQPAPEGSSTAEYRTTTAEPVPSGAGPTSSAGPSFSLDGGPSTGDGPQAVEHGESLTTSPRAVAKPTKPSANTDKAGETAKAWATAYLSRTSDNGDQWKDWMGPYVVPALRDYLTDSTTEQDNPITERVPSEVTKVTIGKHPKGAPADTPVRWTRDVDVAVATGDGRTTTITYELTLNKTGDGWKVRNAVQDSWTTKVTR